MAAVMEEVTLWSWIMTRIIVDKEMRAKLLQSANVEFVDDSGMILGSFVPQSVVSYDPRQGPPISDEERERLYSEPGIYSTEEVLEHLRSL